MDTENSSPKLLANHESPNDSAKAGPWYRDRFFVTLLGAVLGAVGYAVQAIIANHGALALEAERFRAQLVLQAIDVKHGNERRANLKFLLESGLLEDRNGKLTKAVRDTTTEIPRVPRLSPQIFDTDIEGKRLSGTAGALEAAP